MNRQSLSEDPMISDATLRSPEAFAQMAQRFYGRVYFTALGIVRQQDIAEDIAQETFLRAWLKRDTVKEPALLLQPWLVRIATNLALQWLRTGQQRSRLLPLIPMEEVTVEPVDETKPDPRQAAGAAEQRSQVERAVMELPTDLRQVVLLHYAEGLSVREIARMNAEAPSTVTRRLEKARSQLRQHLENGVAAGLAVLKPRGQAQKVFGIITAAAAIPAATRAQLLQLAADTPPPPMIEAVTSAAHAATMEEAGIMKSIIGKIGAAKLIAGAAAIAAVGGGVYGLKTLTADESPNDRDGVELARFTATRVTALASEAAKTEPYTRAGTEKLETPRLAKSRYAKSGEKVNTGATESGTALEAAALSQGENTTSTGEAIAGYVTVRGKVSDVETSQPLVNAIVKVSAPALDMRFQKKYEDAEKLPSTVTDATGSYELKVPLTAGTRSLSLDAFYPGYRSVSGTYTSGGDFSKNNIPVVPDQVLEQNLDLPRARYIAGTVFSESGQPIQGVEVKGTIHAKAERGMAYITITSTDKDGKFSIYDFPTTLTDYLKDVGKLTFTTTSSVTVTIQNLYEMPETELSNLSIVMAKGASIQGQLLNAAGQPASKAQVHLQYVDCNDNERRDVKTDAGGYFYIQGLPDGKAYLYAASTSLDQRAKEEITVPVSGDMTLRMVPTPPADTSKAVTLLGMTLIDVTPELKEKYDLYSTTGVLVLDPGPRIKELFSLNDHDYQPRKGDQLFVAGEERISNIQELVQEMLFANSLSESEAIKLRYYGGNTGVVRIAYNQHKSRANGSMTTHMRLTPDDIRELEAFLGRQGSSDGLVEGF